MEKYKFMVPTFNSLGYRIDQQGLLPIPDRLVAITGAPEPKNVQELRAFLWLANIIGSLWKIYLP